MIDVLITTYNRKDFLKRTLESFFDITRIPFRMFVIDDCSGDGTQGYLATLKHENLAAVILSKQRNGVVYGFDQLWNLSDYFDSFHGENRYMCYLQDDLVSMEKDWLATILDAYENLKDEHRIAFASGHDAIEHPIERWILWNGRRVAVKRSQGATNLIAEKDFWRSIGYIPKNNPDGSVRGHPNGRRGSHIDLYLMGYMSGSRSVSEASAAKNSVKDQGKRILVFPEMLEHLGQIGVRSTWRNGRDERRVAT